MPRWTLTIVERFMEKVSPEPNSGCWLWTGAYGGGPDPRPQFFIDGKLHPASRAAWMLFCGPIVGDLDACHRCDVGACVNPEHLFLGTAVDNIQDCIAKGRFKFLPPAPGEKNSQAILAEQQVLEIRASKRGLDYFARKFGVSRTAVCDARSGNTWPHLPGAVAAKPKNVISDEDKALIRASPEPTGVVAKRYGIPVPTVCRIRGPVMRPSASKKLSEMWAAKREAGL